jgi:hypothetical protein
MGSDDQDQQIFYRGKPGLPARPIHCVESFSDQTLVCAIISMGSFSIILIP